MGGAGCEGAHHEANTRNNQSAEKIARGVHRIDGQCRARVNNEHWPIRFAPRADQCRPTIAAELAWLRVSVGYTRAGFFRSDPVWRHGKLFQRRGQSLLNQYPGDIRNNDFARCSDVTQGSAQRIDIAMRDRALIQPFASSKTSPFDAAIPCVNGENHDAPVRLISPTV